MIGLVTSLLTGPRHALAKPPEFTTKLVEISLAGEVYALSGTAGPKRTPLREFCAPYESAAPGMAGSGDSETLRPHLKTKETITEKYPVRHLQQPLEEGDLGNAYRLPGVENGSKVRSEMVPFTIIGIGEV